MPTAHPRIPLRGLELEDGEELLWSVEPSPWVFVVRVGLAHALLGVIGLGLAWGLDGDDIQGCLSGDPGASRGALVLPALCLALLLAPVWSYFYGRSHLYAITDRRIVIFRRVLGARWSEYRPQNIEYLELQKNSVGSGNLLFTHKLYHSPDGPSLWKYGFFGIHDAAGVRELLVGHPARQDLPPPRLVA